MAGVAVLKLKHIGINKQLTVPIVITSFETTAKPNWASNDVYGRMDPIFTYQNTVRTFTAVLRTPRKNEKFTQKQFELIKIRCAHSQLYCVRPERMRNSPRNNTKFLFLPPAARSPRLLARVGQNMNILPAQRTI